MTETTRAASLLALTALVLRKHTTNQGQLADDCEDQALRLTANEPPANIRAAVLGRAQAPKDPVEDMELLEMPDTPSLRWEVA